MWRRKRLWVGLAILALAALSGNLSVNVVERVVTSTLVD